MHARIAILCHESFRRHDPRNAAIHWLAEIWREEAGLEVVWGYGPLRAPDADLGILQVDLSLVPDAYARLMDRYPIALNRHVLDIRKSRISEKLVGPNDGWGGPVIVKTDLNFGGWPEQQAMPRWRRGLDRLGLGLSRPAGSSLELRRSYLVFSHRSAVPREVWEDPDLVVERFLPERTDDGYATRSGFVLGDVQWCERTVSPDPVAADGSALRIDNVEPHAAVSERCALLRLDFGKVDYTLHEGTCQIFDVNKTVGASRTARNPELLENRRRWARGLDDFLEGRRAPA